MPLSSLYMVATVGGICVVPIVLNRNGSEKKSLLVISHSCPPLESRTVPSALWVRPNILFCGRVVLSYSFVGVMAKAEIAVIVKVGIAQV